MVDYAISAVGRIPGDEKLLNTLAVNDVRPSVEFGNSETTGPWDKIEDTQNRIKITQESEPAHGQSKAGKTPWTDFATRALDRLDDFQRDWHRAENELFSFDSSSNADISSEKGMNATRMIFRDLFKASYHMINSQIRMTLVSSIAGTLKSSITTLYRQQG